MRVEGWFAPGLYIIQDVVMRGHIFLLGKNAEIILPNDMIDLFKPQPSGR
jgi:hypothetical protein